MKKDLLFFSLLFGAAFPLLLGLISVAVWFYADGAEFHALYYLAAGFSAGLMVDLLCLKKWVRNRYTLPLSFMVLLFGIYNLMFYGFFMGFPVFNVFWGFVAGWYIAKRIDFQQIDGKAAQQLLNRTTVFTLLTMVLICTASGYLALSGPTVAGEVSSMLGLASAMSRTALVLLVVVGGFGLLVLQAVLTRIPYLKRAAC